MASSINRIGVNTQGVGAKSGFGIKEKTEDKKEKQTEVAVGSEKPQVSPDKVFDFMAASAVNFVAKKSVDPAKYVDSESKQRIESFMAGFEDKVAEGLKAFEESFPGSKISEQAKVNVVLKQIEREV